MKKVFSVFVALLVLLSLAACGGGAKEGIGYGLVHKHYVGYITVKVEDGKISEAAIDEYYLPYGNFVKVAVTGEAPDDVVATAKDKDGNVTAYGAKYFKVDELLFTASTSETSKVDEESGDTVYTITVTYSASGIANIEEWAKTEANAKKYVDACATGKVFIADAAGNKHATYKTQYEATKDGVDAFKKSTTGYWAAGGVGLGWIKNCEEMVEVIVGTSPSRTDDVKKAEGGKFWSVNGVESGSTWTDFKDYYEVFVRAFENAA